MLKLNYRNSNNYRNIINTSPIGWSACPLDFTIFEEYRPRVVNAENTAKTTRLTGFTETVRQANLKYLIVLIRICTTHGKHVR